MKRKDYNDKYDDFSSLYISPSTKTRRLDPALLQFKNEEDPSSIVPQIIQPLPQELPSLTTSSNMAPIDAPVDGGGNEKALVLYNPINTPMFKSPTSPDFSVVVNSDLIPGLRDRFFCLGNSKMVKPLEEEKKKTKEESTYVSDNRLALIPWVATQGDTQVLGPLDPMEAEDVEMMDTDDGSSGGVTEGAGGLQQWQQLQQHCTKSELFQNTHTHVTW